MIELSKKPRHSRGMSHIKERSQQIQRQGRRIYREILAEGEAVSRDRGIGIQMDGPKVCIVAEPLRSPVGQNHEFRRIDRRADKCRRAGTRPAMRQRMANPRMIGIVRRIVLAGLAGLAMMTVIAGGGLRLVMLGMRVGREAIRAKENSEHEDSRKQRFQRDRRKPLMTLRKFQSINPFNQFMLTLSRYGYGINKMQFLIAVEPVSPALIHRLLEQ